MAQEREKRVVLIATEPERCEIRVKAAEIGVSVSKMGRDVLLAFARGQLVRAPRLPGIDADLPDWLM